ncbi:MAG: response regulator [Sphingomonadaceae bacterium]|nr:response regulator [Sphingomonadaceae bacterium]
MSAVEAPFRSWERPPVPFAVGSVVQATEMIDVLPLGIAVLNTEGICYQVNAAFAETVEYDCVESGDILNLAVPADRPMLAAAIADILSWHQRQIECRLHLAIRPHELAVVNVIRAPINWGFGALVAVRDIREQVRLEQQVAQATKMQAVGQLAGGIAHDFNNILTAVLGLCAQLLDRRVPGDDDYDDLDEIRINAGRAAKLVAQLLAFSRQQTLRPEVVNVAAAITGVEALLRRLVGPDVDLIVEPSTGVILADPGQLEQVLTNLAVNARDAMSGSGRLTIAAREIAARDVAALGYAVMPTIDYVVITVVDTGTGIAPEIAGKIFEPFFTTKPIGEGTGLGLSTVYGIVKQTDGFIFATPADGGGTCFAVYLPATVASASAAAPVAPPALRPPLSGTVLLVEDERAVRLVVERALRRAGFNVITASDGGVALDVIGTATVDVLVSDVVMPGIDGVELLNRIRTRRPRLPVVLMSGYADPPQRRALEGAGAVFLAKPFTADDLLAALRAAVAAQVLDTP